MPSKRYPPRQVIGSKGLSPAAPVFAWRRFRRVALSLCVAGLSCLATHPTHANGRLPAATGLAIHPTDDQQLLLGLTYGLALTRDGGANWTWVCEGQIEGNGGDVDPAIVMTGNGTLVVLSLTNRGVIVSGDNGCTFERRMGPLDGNRGVDLTLDASQPGRVLVLTSTVVERDDAGAPRFRNLVAHSLDHGSTWQVLSELPDDMLPETIEIAASDARRIYVTGVAVSDLLEGIVERSDDGGMSWKRTTVRLPRGSGSMFVSAIHPTDPDRLWIRVPGRGDIYGVLPAKLWLSMDGGANFDQVGETRGGMLGFALSPEGDRVAFGGPSDGLYIVPSNASDVPTKTSDMPVSCLHWRSNGLYACALEPGRPFSLGLAVEPTQDFVPLWHRANSCRPTCAPPSHLEARCKNPWEDIAPLIDASTPVCDGSSSALDAGMAGVDAEPGAETPRLDGGGAMSAVLDASPVTTKPPEDPARGCAVISSVSGSPPEWLVGLLLLILATAESRRRLR